MDGTIVKLADHRQETARATAADRGDPVVFGVELPPRGDLVMAVTALAQLVSIADGVGLDAAGDLETAIARLVHRLQAHSVGLPPHLRQAIDQGTRQE